MLRKGDHSALVRECTLERIEEAGSGGTAELLAYMPAIAWRSGTGMVIWNDLADSR